MQLKSFPLEILIMILEMLGIDDAFNLCQALEIPKVQAFKYHQYDPEEIGSYFEKIYDNETSKLLNTSFSHAILKNVKFQVLAEANDKVMFAILSQDLNLVRNALEDPRVNHDDKWCSPLRIACEYGSLDAVKLLVNEYGINISARDNKALFGACSHGHLDIVKCMLSHPDFDPERCSKALISASEHASIVRLLLSDPRFDPSFDRNRTIVEAARNGNTEIVQLLLEDPKVDPADQYNFALIYSVGNGHAEIVKLLLEDPRVNLLEVENTRLIEVAFTGEIEKTRILLEDSENYISKIGEATENVEKILRLLLEYRDGMNDKRVDL